MEKADLGKLCLHLNKPVFPDEVTNGYNAELGIGLRKHHRNYAWLSVALLPEQQITVTRATDKV